MKDTVDRVLSVIVAVAAITVAGVAVHREFGGPSRPAARVPVPTAPVFMSDWRSLLPSAIIAGRNNAEVTIVEFSDLECPFCRRLNDALHSIRRRFGDSVAVAFIHLPISSHRFARPAARAFGKCMALSDTLSSVEAGVRMAHKIGVLGTPTVLVNGWRYSTPPSEDELAGAIARILSGKSAY
jgi:protein-disulfide isomerase